MWRNFVKFAIFVGCISGHISYYHVCHHRFEEQARSESLRFFFFFAIFRVCLKKKGGGGVVMTFKGVPS